MVSKIMSNLRLTWVDLFGSKLTEVFEIGNSRPVFFSRCPALVIDKGYLLSFIPARHKRFSGHELSKETTNRP
jgi:hypothetical protein